MELIERYLQAIRWWLPAGHKDDVLAELRAELHAQVDERAEALKSPLDDAEVEVILKHFGRPHDVALRYYPQRSLIGPSVFPIYWATLRGAFLFVLLPCLAVRIGLAIFLPQYREAGVWLTLVEIWLGVFSAAFWIFSAVTLVFVGIDYLSRAGRLGRDWSPRDLPPVRDESRRSRLSASLGLAMQLLFLGWWIASPLETVGPAAIGLGAPAGPILHDLHQRYFFVVVLLILASAAISVVNLARPYWTRARRVWRAGLWIVLAVLAGVFVRSHMETLGLQARAIHAIFVVSRQPSPMIAMPPIFDVIMFAGVCALGIGATVAAVVDIVRILTGSGDGGDASRP